MDKHRVVFTNGCFDLFHVGHLRFLGQARRLGESLIVGLNSDESVRELKGKGRPIIPQDQRAEILTGLWIVNGVVIFDTEHDLLSLIKEVRPAVLAKGEDWKKEEIVGADFMKMTGGRVVTLPLIPSVSTTKIIEKIKNEGKDL